jgi:hypothetical protein
MTTKKKPSLQTRLKNAEALAGEHRLHAEKLQKQLDDKERSLGYANDRAKAAEAEIAQVHAFLDAVPNPPADKLADGYSKVGAMTRLAVFLANGRAQVMA